MGIREMARKSRRKRVGRTLSLRLWSSSWLAIWKRYMSYNIGTILCQTLPNRIRDKFSIHSSIHSGPETRRVEETKGQEYCLIQVVVILFTRSFNVFGDLGIRKKRCQRPEVTALYTMDDRRAKPKCKHRLGKVGGKLK